MTYFKITAYCLRVRKIKNKPVTVNATSISFFSNNSIIRPVPSGTLIYSIPTSKLWLNNNLDFNNCKYWSKIFFSLQIWIGILTYSSQEWCYIQINNMLNVKSQKTCSGTAANLKTIFLTDSFMIEIDVYIWIVRSE